MWPLRAFSIELACLGLLVFTTFGRAGEMKSLVGCDVVAINDLSPAQPGRAAGLSRIHRIYRVLSQTDTPATEHTLLKLTDPSGTVQGYLPRKLIKLYEEALDYYNEVIQIDPTKAEPYLRRGYLWRDRKEEAIALLDFNKAIELTPGYAEAYFARGLLWFDKGRPKMALEDYAMALRLGGSSSLLRLAMGDAWSIHARFTKDPKALESAIEQFGFALKHNPNLTYAYLGRADAYLHRKQVGDIARAKDDLEHAIQSASKFAPAYAARGMYYLQVKEYGKAISDGQQATKFDANCAPAYRVLGLAHLARRELNLAFKSFDEAIHKDPKDAASHLGRGRAHFLQNHLDSALYDFEQAVTYDCTNPSVYVERGVARYRKALRDYMRFPSKSTDKQAQKQADSDLTVAFEKAETDFTQALRFNAQFAPAFVGRGRLREAQSRHEDALRDDTTAIWLDPNLGDAYLARAWTLATCPRAELRDPPLAIASAKRARELLGSRDPDGFITLATAYLSNGDYKQAGDVFIEFLSTSIGVKKPGAN